MRTSAAMADLRAELARHRLRAKDVAPHYGEAGASPRWVRELLAERRHGSEDVCQKLRAAVARAIVHGRVRHDGSD
jgi:hypothetical protein